MRILITGGAGFVGSHLADELLARGHAVHVLDDLSTGSIDEHPPPARTHPRFELHDRVVPQRAARRRARRRGGHRLPPGRGRRRRADRREPGPHDRDEHRHDRGRPRAAPARRRSPSSSPRRARSTARAPTSRSARTATCSWARRSRAAGRTPARRRSTSSWRSPTTRSAGCRRSSAACSTRSARARPAATAWSCPNFVGQALAGDPLRVFGDGTQSRCFCHVADVVRALADLMETRRVLRRGLQHRHARPRSRSPASPRRSASSSARTAPITYVPYAEAYEEGFEDMQRRIPDIDEDPRRHRLGAASRRSTRSSSTSRPTRWRASSSRWRPKAPQRRPLPCRRTLRTGSSIPRR